MYISGIGTIGSFGRGLESLKGALLNGWVPPEMMKVHGVDEDVPVYSVKKEDLKDKVLFKNMRRADRFSKMSVIAAYDAYKDSDIDSSDSLGIILATGFGPHKTTFDFLDGYIDYGEAAVSPTSFSHSVHNAAASYIGTVLDIRGPTQTVTDFDLPFQKALLLAKAWLEQKRCKNILLGCVDVLGPQMEYIFSRKYSFAKDGKIQPFSFLDDPQIVPGEGAVFFMLSLDEEKKSYCQISDIGANVVTGKSSHISLIDADGMSGSESEYKAFALGNYPLLASYTAIFGSMKINSVFHCAVGALMLTKGCVYPCPIIGNPFNANICCEHKPMELNSVSIVKHIDNSGFYAINLV